LEYAKTALALNPKREDTWGAYAAALAAVGRFDEAVECQQRYAASKVLNERYWVEAESMVSLYKSHQPYIAPYPPTP
jgi:predicted Zn-dependent protease